MFEIPLIWLVESVGGAVGAGNFIRAQTREVSTARRKETTETDITERRLQTNGTECISEGCDQCAFIAFSHSVGTVKLL